MPKISIIPNPTFDLIVNLNDDDDHQVPVKFTFNHKTRSTLEEFLKKDLTYTDMIMDIVSGWDFEEEFNRENVELLLENRMSSGNKIISNYISSLSGTRVKN